MMRNKKLLSRRGFSFAEYALLLGIVLVAFLAMQAYIRRGTQGRIKDLADQFISPEATHTSTIDNEVKSSSETRGEAQSVVEHHLEGGRLTRDIPFDRRNSFTVSDSEEETNSSLFGDGSTFYTPPDDTASSLCGDVGTEDWSLEVDVSALCEELARLNEKLAMFSQEEEDSSSLWERIANWFGGGSSDGLGRDAEAYEECKELINAEIARIEDRLGELGGECN